MGLTARKDPPAGLAPARWQNSSEDLKSVDTSSLPVSSQQAESKTVSTTDAKAASSQGGRVHALPRRLWSWVRPKMNISEACLKAMLHTLSYHQGCNQGCMILDSFCVLSETAAKCRDVSTCRDLLSRARQQMTVTTQLQEQGKEQAACHSDLCSNFMLPGLPLGLQAPYCLLAACLYRSAPAQHIGCGRQQPAEMSIQQE